MNPAAPSPSDSSIAQQALQEIIQSTNGGYFSSEMHKECVSIAKRALLGRELDASAPAAAVGGDGDLLKALERRAVFAKCIQGDLLAIPLLAAIELIAAANVAKPDPVAWQVRHFFAGGYWSGWAQVPSEDEAKAAVERHAKVGTRAEYRCLYAATPAAPVGGFLVDDGSLLRQLCGIKAMWESGYTEVMEIHPKDSPVASLFVLDLDSFIKKNMAKLQNTTVLNQSATPLEHKLSEALRLTSRWYPAVLMRGGRHHRAVVAAHKALEDYDAQVQSTAAQPSAKDGVRGCEWCNGTGWLGGPSYAQPDEGGVECTHCNGLSEEATTAAGLVDGGELAHAHEIARWAANAEQWKLLAIERKAELETMQERYYDLIMQVGNKHEGESRHETAKRYLQLAEQVEVQGPHTGEAG